MDRSFILKIYILFGIMVSAAGAQSIINTKHNLSVSGPGTIKAQSEQEVCIFCHTPHSSSPIKPLWNRNDPGVTYSLYSSSTAQANTGQPQNSSLLCLSCHDGTIALGNVISRSNDILMSGGVTTMPAGRSNLSTDLSDDHPISFIYNSSLANQDGHLVDPAVLTGPVQLENNMMECSSCHDAHKDIYNNFLTASNSFSDLCLYCHEDPNWNNSRHKTSNKSWNGSGTDPWYHTDFTTVSENACENCHAPHKAERHNRLMNFSTEEMNCLVCHNGNVASKNIQAQFNKAYTHAISTYNNVHDPTEPAVIQTKHVECEDCHNPHAVAGSGATPPNASGSLRGVRGVNSNGSAVSEVSYEYELCYRCHADSPDKPGSPTLRQIEQNNVRLEYDLGNPSFHPVEGAGKNSNVPSLVSPYTVTSKIYCTDCHASDGNGAPKGPHGSTYPHILKYNYITADNTPESSQAYALCYSCHQRNSILGDNSFERHDKHIRDLRTPCNVCHDPHGISISQGTTANNSHLINFDLSVVTPSSSGRLEFIDNGVFSGTCYLRCHGENHNPLSY